MSQSENVENDECKINIPGEGQYLIRPSTPCPICRGLLLKREVINYICSNCHTIYNVVGQGIMDDELLYEVTNEDK